MGNTRRFKAGRRQKVLSQRDKIKLLTAQVGYLEGANQALAAQVTAARMERPADLDEWIASVLPDMDEDEQAEWDAMTGEEREAFKEALGAQINQSAALLDLADEVGDPVEGVDA